MGVAAMKDDDNKAAFKDFGRDLGSSMLSGLRNWLQWIIAGAGAGAIVGGGIAAYFVGSSAILTGVWVGALIGGIGIGLLYAFLMSG